MKETKKQTQDDPNGRTVELIGGPHCGDFRRWVGGRTMEFRYTGGSLATYEYEGNGKAKHISG